MPLNFGLRQSSQQVERPSFGRLMLMGMEKVWTCSVPRLRNELDDVRVVRSNGHSIEIQKKYRPNQMVRCPAHGGTPLSILRAKVAPRF